MFWIERRRKGPRASLNVALLRCWDNVGTSCASRLSWRACPIFRARPRTSQQNRVGKVASGWCRRGPVDADSLRRIDFYC